MEMGGANASKSAKSMMGDAKAEKMSSAESKSAKAMESEGGDAEMGSA